MGQDGVGWLAFEIVVEEGHGVAVDEGVPGSVVVLVGPGVVARAADFDVELGGRELVVGPARVADVGAGADVERAGLDHDGDGDAGQAALA